MGLEKDSMQNKNFNSKVLYQASKKKKCQISQSKPVKNRINISNNGHTMAQLLCPPQGSCLLVILQIPILAL